MGVPLWFFVWTQHTPLSPVPRVSPLAGREGCRWWLSGFGFRPETQMGVAGNPSAYKKDGLRGGLYDPP